MQGQAEILNPTLEGLYPILRDVLSEMKEVFVDDYIHLGNDEVYYDCWKSNPNITEWMNKNNLSQYNQLEAYYTSRLLKIVKDLKKKVTVWQDVYDNGVKLDKETQIQIWKDTNTRELFYLFIFSPSGLFLVFCFLLFDYERFIFQQP